MQRKLNDLIEKIENGKFPTEFPHFAGADLIITNDPKRNFHEGDSVIYSDHAAALSWLIAELKTIYDAQLNWANKYDFYPVIGQLIKASVEDNDDLFETMLYVVHRIEENWK
jgi:hypothetical protein